MPVGTPSTSAISSRHLVELEHHEKRALLDAHHVEHLVELARSRALSSWSSGPASAVLNSPAYLGRGHLATHPRATAMRRRDADADAIEPRRDLRAPREAAELTAHDDEHFLHDVLEVCVANAEPLKGAPDEVPVPRERIGGVAGNAGHAFHALGHGFPRKGVAVDLHAHHGPGGRSLPMSGCCRTRASWKRQPHRQLGGRHDDGLLKYRRILPDDAERVPNERHEEAYVCLEKERRVDPETCPGRAFPRCPEAAARRERFERVHDGVDLAGQERRARRELERSTLHEESKHAPAPTAEIPNAKPLPVVGSSGREKAGGEEVEAREEVEVCRDAGSPSGSREKARSREGTESGGAGSREGKGACRDGVGGQGRGRGRGRGRGQGRGRGAVGVVVAVAVAVRVGVAVAVAVAVGVTAAGRSAASGSTNSARAKATADAAVSQLLLASDSTLASLAWLRPRHEYGHERRTRYPPSRRSPPPTWSRHRRTDRDRFARAPGRRRRARRDTMPPYRRGPTTSESSRWTSRQVTGPAVATPGKEHIGGSRCARERR